MKLTSKQKRQILFLTETGMHYHSNNRGIHPNTENGCSYTAGCAIGRKISPTLAARIEKHGEALGDSSVDNDNIFVMLPASLQSLGVNFLGDIQKLHDGKENWSADGLSANGIIEFRAIYQDILKGNYA